MTVVTDVFVMIRQRMPTLSKTERRVAEMVLAHPDSVLLSTVNELAELCDTSQASIARFCRAVGFEGYREFRLAIAAANSREETARNNFRVADSEISPTDSALEVVTKVAYQEARAIEETARALDLTALDAIVEAVRGAARIDIYGAGSSGLTAQDLQQKLHRVGLTSFCFGDMHIALTSFALSRPGCVAIAISHSGVTLEAIQTLEIARKAGATTVAITNFPKSPLALSADLVLTTSARETRYRSGAMVSRIAQMALVDFLVVRLLQGNYDAANEALRRTYDAVQSHRLPYTRAAAESPEGRQSR